MEFKVGKIMVAVIDLGDASVLSRLAHGLAGEPDQVFLFSDEWERRRPQCEAFVQARAGLFERRVGARACAVREIPRAQATPFLDRCHVQGSNRLALVRFGLFHGEDLVGVLSLGRHPRQISQNWIVLDRLCFAPGVQVVGGASRLFSAAVAWARERQYDDIVSYSDNRLTPGAVYERIGFARHKTYRPDYFYVRDGRRVSKQSQRKSHTGCPADLTEWEWAQERGLTRVYDAGKVCWIYCLNTEVRDQRRARRSASTAQMHADGVYRHAHVRGVFPTAKGGGAVYFGSSYELRCLFELDQDPLVAAVRRCETFQAADGRWRNPDLLVTFSDGHEEIWEVKPFSRLDEPDVKDQLADSTAYAIARGVPLRVWTERDSALGKDARVIAWAHRYLATQQDDHTYEDRAKAQRKAIRDRHYAKEQAASVTVFCPYCGVDHVVLPRTYARNLARNGGVYVCEALGGHIGGSKPKLALRKENPYAAEGRKQCCRCGAVLPLAAFARRARARDGLSGACRACCSVADAAAYRARVQKKARDSG
ncbi:MAG: GNAT family N-acetyltransferase [bacterium]